MQKATLLTVLHYILVGAAETKCIAIKHVRLSPFRHNRHEVGVDFAYNKPPYCVSQMGFIKRAPSILKHVFTQN